jgi:hypothetical protein
MPYSERETAYFDTMRVAVLVPIAMFPQPRFVKSLVNMTAFSWANGIRVYEMGDTIGQVIHWARDTLAEQALEAQSPAGPYTHFLWLDSDHVFKPYLLCRLARHMANVPEVDSVSALYYARTGKPFPVAYVKDTSKDDPYIHWPLLGIPDSLCEVDAVGFGALLMKRQVLEALPAPRFRFAGCGEDIYFCVNAKKAGKRLFLDGALKIEHIKDPDVVNEKTFTRYCEEHAEELGERIPIALGG